MPGRRKWKCIARRSIGAQRAFKGLPLEHLHSFSWINGLRKVGVSSRVYLDEKDDMIDELIFGEISYSGVSTGLVKKTIWDLWLRDTMEGVLVNNLLNYDELMRYEDVMEYVARDEMMEYFMNALDKLFELLKAVPYEAWPEPIPLDIITNLLEDYLEDLTIVVRFKYIPWNIPTGMISDETMGLIKDWKETLKQNDDDHKALQIYNCLLDKCLYRTWLPKKINDLKLQYVRQQEGDALVNIFCDLGQNLYELDKDTFQIALVNILQS